MLEPTQTTRCVQLRRSPLGLYKHVRLICVQKKFISFILNYLKNKKQTNPKWVKTQKTKSRQRGNGKVGLLGNGFNTGNNLSFVNEKTQTNAY